MDALPDMCTPARDAPEVLLDKVLDVSNPLGQTRLFKRKLNILQHTFQSSVDNASMLGQQMRCTVMHINASVRCTAHDCHLAT